jgi:hypothetical protein
MRNPDRIDEFCEWLRFLWHKCPDWRFGQLVSNVYGIEENPRFFYMEDDEAMKLIQIWSTER